MHSGEKARKPEPLIQQAAWCSAFIRIAESELKYHQWCQKTVTWFLGMQKFHNLDSPCMHSGSHIIKPVIYEKQKPFVYLLEQKLAIAWSHPRAIHEYTSISFRSARLCHGTVIFITVSLEQMCFKGCLMSLKYNLQGRLGPVPCGPGVSFQHHEQHPDPQPEPFFPSWSVHARVGTKGILHS